MPKKSALSSYQKSLPDLYKEFKSSEKGLTTEVAGSLLDLYGENVLPKERPPKATFLFISQFKNPLVYVLLAASFITGIFLKDLIDSLIILIAVFINSIVGFIQEYKASHAIDALKSLIVPRAKVKRDGVTQEIDSRWLVPGDVIFLSPGFRVPADARLIEEHSLKINEASLTGESVPVEKSTVIIRKEALLSERKNLVFAGAEVVEGTGVALVFATGGNTEVGKIGKLINGVSSGKTPLQTKIENFSKSLAGLLLLLCAVVFGIGLLLGYPLKEMFTLSVALSVAAIPEGLVVTVTVILALGMQKIYKRNALVRKLVSAETLGSVTVICVDKTGTITEGKMEATRVDVKDTMLFAHAGALCNDLLNQTETALWERVSCFHDHNFDPQKVRDSIPRFSVIPFASSSRFMATLHPWNSKEVGIVFVKGAPDKLLGWSKISASEKESWEKKITTWSKEGERVLGFAYKIVKLPTVADLCGFDSDRKSGRVSLRSSEKKMMKELLSENLESGFTFLGLLGISDPIREEVASALRLAQGAGIKVVVITGDYRETAISVMGKIGIPVEYEETISGEELNGLTDDELYAKIENVKLFSRVTPSEKLKIVQAFRRHGEVVAMTGDGVNDAPALKQADIGVVVGTATEVAKETADMVLLDSNFSTIVASIEEGRNIFENIKKVLTYLLTDSFSEVILVGGSLLLGIPIPVTAVQILWVNLVEDSFPAMALAFEKEKENVMKDPPRRIYDSLFDKEVKMLVFIVGLTTDLCLLGLYFFLLRRGLDSTHLRTLMFAALGIDSLFYALSLRSLRRNIWHFEVFKNMYLNISLIIGFMLLLLAIYFPFLQRVIGTKSLTFFEMLVLIAIGIFNLSAIELGKWYYIRKIKRWR